MDGYLVRELYQSEGETLLPPDLPRLYQQPHQAPLRQYFTVQTHFSGFAEVLQEAAQQRQSRADREQEAEQGPESQDRTEFPSDHRLCYGVGQGTETILTNSTESCVLLTVEHKETKNSSGGAVSVLPAGAKESGIFVLYYVELVTGLRGGTSRPAIGGP